MTEDQRPGREHTIGGSRTFTVYDGGRTVSPRTRVEAEKQFLDTVMGEGKVIIDEGLSDDSAAQDQDTETVIEYVGPKRLPRIITKVKQEETEDRAWNIINLFKKRR